MLSLYTVWIVRHSWIWGCLEKAFMGIWIAEFNPISFQHGSYLSVSSLKQSPKWLVWLRLGCRSVLWWCKLWSKPPQRWPILALCEMLDSGLGGVSSGSFHCLTFVWEAEMVFGLNLEAYLSRLSCLPPLVFPAQTPLHPTPSLRNERDHTCRRGQGHVLRSGSNHVCLL